MPTTSQNLSGTTGTSTTQRNTGTSTTTPTSPATTVQNNLSAIPGLQNLTSLINAINQQSQSFSNLNRVQGEQGLESQSSANISSALAGQLGAGTKQQLSQAAAESGVGTGQASDAAYLRALGLTSEQLENTGQSWLSAAVARNPGAATYDPTTGLLTAAQGGQTTTQNTENQGSQTTNTSQASNGSSSDPVAAQQKAQANNNSDLWSALFGTPNRTGTSGGVSPGASGGVSTNDTDRTAGLSAGGSFGDGQGQSNPWANLGFSDTEYNSLFGNAGNANAGGGEQTVTSAPDYTDDIWGG